MPEETQPFLREAMIRSLHNSALRLWRYANGPDTKPLPEPFVEAEALALVREMLESLMQHRAPRDNIEHMARTAKGADEAKFYRRVVDRKDGRNERANRPKFKRPFDEAGTLRGIIGNTLLTTPDQVIIDFNRAAWASRQALQAAGQTGSLEETALGYEMEWYEDLMDRSGVTERYLAQARKGGH